MTTPPETGTIGRRGILAALLVGGAALASPALFTQSSGPANPVALPDFRPAGARDDNEALRRALATGRPVHLPAGRGSASDGAYLIETAAGTNNLVSGAWLFGDGMGRTVIRRPYRTGSFIFFVNSGFASAARNLTNIRFADLTLEDDVARRGFEEHNHLMHLNGVTGLQIDRVGFRGFRGDGLHLGSGEVLGMERHNLDIAVRGCTFDGINRNNRNALTIIDGERVLIQDCRFLNCTRPGRPPETAQGSRAWNSDPHNPRTGISMPGAIDCEPNADLFANIRNVRIERCSFSGGGGAAVALLLRPNDRMITAHNGFTIRDCTIERNRLGFSLFGYDGENAIIHPADYGVVIEDNRLSNCEKPFIVNGMRGLAMRRNEYSDCAQSAELGYTAYNARCSLIGNRFIRIGTAAYGGLNGLLVRFASDVLLEGNAFIDCGLANGGGGRAINFIAGRISRFRLINNRFESPTGRTTYAIAVQGAQMDRSNSASGNVFTFQTNRDFG
jgi:hypothetical protein